MHKKKHKERYCIQCYKYGKVNQVFYVMTLLIFIKIYCLSLLFSKGITYYCYIT